MQLGEFTLRDDQERVYRDVRQAVWTLKQSGRPARVLVQCPCGWGKTVFSCAMMATAYIKGKSSGFVVRGRRLVEQKSDKLRRANVPHSVLMDGYDYHQSGATVVSIDTHRSRVQQRQSVPALTPDFWVVDEAHLGMDQYAPVVESAEVVVGLTATPAQANGKNLGQFWTHLVRGPSYSELIERRLLVPCRVFAERMPDISQLKMNDGDWSQQAVGELMDNKELVGDTVRDWKRWGENRPTLVFCASVEQSIGLVAEWNAAGIPTAHVDADTPTDERDEAFRKLEFGQLKAISNVGVLVTGVDFPFASCLVLAFATNSVVKFMQVAGRGLRTFPEKQDCVIIDHGGNVHRHGWPTEDRPWSLNFEGSIRDFQQQERERLNQVREPICCPKCGAMRLSGPKCVNCGHEHKRTGIKVRFRDGTIGPVKEKKAKKAVSDKQKAWMQILAVCAWRNLPVSAASAMYHKKTGVWPDKDGVRPVPEWSKRGLLVKHVYPKFIRKKQAAE